MTVTSAASPSLALVKYWGKLSGGVNLPATSSLAVTLDGLRTKTRITDSGEDSVVLDGSPQPMEAFTPIIDEFRRRSSSTANVRIESTNNFPTAAGIASSSSGFAALALALDSFFATGMTPGELSAAARIGSGSAARAVFGGFTAWRAGKPNAERVYEAGHWSDLRILIVLLHAGKKPISSRAGMNRTAATSPIYDRWCTESEALFARALEALRARDLESLGTAMRESYLFMFSTMFTTRPPVIYWLPESLAVIRAADAMRSSGIPVWETMDAGPQVKLVTTAEHASRVRSAVLAEVPGAKVVESLPGGEPEVARG